MKILMVTRRFPPDCISGTETVCRSLYHYAREHHEVRLVTGWARARSLVPPEAVAVDFSRGSSAKKWLRMTSAVRGEVGKWKPDVLLTNTFELPRASVPTVGLIQDLEKGNRMGWRKIVHSRLIAAKAKRLDLVVTSTSSSARKLAEIGISEKRLRVIPNGVDLEKYSPENNSSPKTQIICPSRIFRGKGQHLVIDAFARLQKKHKNRATLRIVGAVQDRVYLDRLIVQAHGQPVQFALDVPDMQPHYNGADIVVLPSLMQEGFSNTAAEAMASGKALIWFDQPVVREATGGQGIAVPMTDVDAMTKAMGRLIENREEREEYGRSGRRYAEGNLDWRRIWQQYEAAIHSVTMGPRWN
jgi:glycosyltransferase involved in cell wall biosynthesis